MNKNNNTNFVQASYERSKYDKEGTRKSSKLINESES